MTTDNWQWRRDKPGLGVWDGRGKTAFAGWGMSPIDRRWDGISMDRTLGEFSILAAQRALEDAGLKPEDVDGLFQCPNNMAGVNSGSSANWGPDRPYFDPPYDSEDGLTVVTNKWILNNWSEINAKGNIKFSPDEVPDIGEGLGMAAQAVADGKCEVALFIYTANNLEGRYRRGGTFAEIESRGPNQWTNPWGGSIIDLQLWGTLPIQEYCRKYGTTWEELMAPLIINEHRNGLMNDWGYYSTNGPSGLDYESYVNSRPITWPARIWDYDRPVNAAGAFVITTAERAKDMRHKPVYILNHNQGWMADQRSSHMRMSEWEAGMSKIAGMAYEGSGLKPEEIDIFNPYDGFSPFMPFSLEAFQWHGVKQGEAKDFVKGDISVEGPNPIHSGGGNLGNGRTRTAMYIDSIEQLRGTAGKRQVNTRADTAIAGYAPGLTAWYLVLASEPD
ncbi:MAG: thiolase family protein [Chloroflexi bacterium]|nr:thiolase family protein [Chloroflexota bacterium]